MGLFIIIKWSICNTSSAIFVGLFIWSNGFRFYMCFGSDKKYKVILGGLFAVTLSVFSYFVSGVVFFAEFAPEGMNTYLYSFLYNFTSAGVEGILCIMILSIIPLGRFKKIANVKDIAA